MTPINFDYQSGAPLWPEVFEAMQPFLLDSAHPSSLHRRGVTARAALALAREQVAHLIHARYPDEIVFCASGTEAANLAIKGTAEALRPRGRHLILSAIEHPAVRNSARWLERQGFTLTILPVDRFGLINAEAVREAITRETILVSVHWANHEIGTIEPMRKIAEICAEREVILFSDACAAAGQLSLDVQATPVSLLSLSPHRFHGPKGVGILYIKRGTPRAAQMHGGQQEHELRAGTENLAGTVGAGCAAQLTAARLDTNLARIQPLQRRLWEGLSAIPQMQWHGPPIGPQRLTHHLHFSAAHAEGEAQALLCDLQGFLVTSGAACITGSLRISPVLRAIGVEETWARCNLLLTLGAENTGMEVERFLKIYPGIVRKLRTMSPGWSEANRENEKIN